MCQGRIRRSVRPHRHQGCLGLSLHRQGAHHHHNQVCPHSQGPPLSLGCRHRRCRCQAEDSVRQVADHPEVYLHRRVRLLEVDLELEELEKLKIQQRLIRQVL